MDVRGRDERCPHVGSTVSTAKTAEASFLATSVIALTCCTHQDRVADGRRVTRQEVDSAEMVKTAWTDGTSTISVRRASSQLRGASTPA